MDADTALANIQYAMVHGSFGDFYIPHVISKIVHLEEIFLYIRMSGDDNQESEYSLDFTTAVESYLNSGKIESLYKDISENLHLRFGPWFSGNGDINLEPIEKGAAGAAGAAGPSTSVPIGSLLSQALGFKKPATLEMIGEKIVSYLYPNLKKYKPDSAVLMTKFTVTKSAAQNALRAAAHWLNPGFVRPDQSQLRPYAVASGFFSNWGLPYKWAAVLQDKNEDVGGVLDDLSSCQGYTKFIAISASSLSELAQ
jgi:hypothetical protein